MNNSTSSASSKFVLGLLFGLLASGIALVVLGALVPNRTVSLVTTSFGAVIFGSSLAPIISQRLGVDALKDVSDHATDALKEIQQTYAEIVSAEFLSSEENISPYRKKWHFYHVTTKGESQYAWHHGILDFTLRHVDRKLLGYMNEHQPISESAVTYRVEAGIRGPRFVLIFSRADDVPEPPGVTILPSVGTGVAYIHCGIGILHTWQDRTALIPVIVCENPVHNCIEEGFVPNDLLEQFDKTWKEEFYSRTSVLPLAKSD